MSIWDRFRKGKKDKKDGAPPDQSVYSQPEFSEPLPAQDFPEKTEEQQWAEMKVPPAEVRVFSTARNSPLTPEELDRTTKQLNKVLKHNGFTFDFTYHRTLGALSDQLTVFKMRREVIPLPMVALYQYADYLLRKQEKIDRKSELSSLQKMKLKEIVSQLEQAAKKQKELNKLAKIAAGGPKYVDPFEVKPVIAKTLEELLTMEAQFQARRELKLGNDDPVPPEVMEQFMAKAWERYRTLKGLPNQ